MDILITDSAQEYLQNLLKKQNIDGIAVRLFVTQPGTPHAETCLAYCKPGEEKTDDIILSIEKIKCFIEAASQYFLKDAKIDFSKDTLGGQLTIKAPNAKLPAINDHSSLEQKINYYLQTEINPSLASHGGLVSLVEIQDDQAILRFGGGCQGCSAVDLTLKSGVEKTLMDKIPALTGVKDITDHSFTENAYFKD